MNMPVRAAAWAVSIRVEGRPAVACSSLNEIVAALRPLVAAVHAAGAAVHEAEETLAGRKLALGQALLSARDELRRLGMAGEWSALLAGGRLGMHRRTVENLVATAIGLKGGVEAARRKRLEEMPEPVREYWAAHPLFDPAVKQISHKGLMRIVGAQPLPGLRFRGENAIPTVEAAEDEAAEPNETQPMRPGAHGFVDKSKETTGQDVVRAGPTPRLDGPAATRTARVHPGGRQEQLRLDGLYQAAEARLSRLLQRVHSRELGQEMTERLVAFLEEMQADETARGATVKLRAGMEHAAAE